MHEKLPQIKHLSIWKGFQTPKLPFESLAFENISIV